MSDAGRLNRGDVADALKETGRFNTWKLTVERNQVVSMNTSEKMDYVLAGIHTGVTAQTAVLVCGVREDEFNAWLSNPDNAYAFQRAMSLSDAHLEAVLYEAAKKNPILAREVLKDRNPKRYASADSLPFTPQKARGVSKMSGVLEAKRNQTLNNPVDFDVSKQ